MSQEISAPVEDKKNKINADPTKDFFVNMITRDIALADCIFDLLDNSIDGARRKIDSSQPKPFSGFEIQLNFDKNGFSISDNCGGIPLAEAENHAFHFGRKSKDDVDVKGGIGLYGIGMKRALFKIGRWAEVISHTPENSFRVELDVDAWMKEIEWDFSWQAINPEAVSGTIINVKKLNHGISEIFSDADFVGTLIQAISRDYTFFIDKGLTIKVGETVAPSLHYGLKQNENISPGVFTYEDNGISVRIIAGLIEDLPDDIPDEIRPGLTERFGWYVICNDRVVLAADKSSKTVWGNDGFAVWHPQYTGFGGFVFFQSDDQNSLPWTTTKRDLDISSPLYRRTISNMKEMTTEFTRYTTRRKAELDNAKTLEANSRNVNVYALSQPATNAPSASTPLKLPTFTSPAGPAMVNISFKRKKTDVDEVKKELGDQFMSNTNMGQAIFDYYLTAELGK